MIQTLLARLATHIKARIIQNGGYVVPLRESDPAPSKKLLKAVHEEEMRADRPTTKVAVLRVAEFRNSSGNEKRSRDRFKYKIHKADGSVCCKANDPLSLCSQCRKKVAQLKKSL